MNDRPDRDGLSEERLPLRRPRPKRTARSNRERTQRAGRLPSDQSRILSLRVITAFFAESDFIACSPSDSPFDRQGSGPHVCRELRYGRQLGDRQHAFCQPVGRHGANDLQPVRAEIAEVRTQGGGERHLDSHGDSEAADGEQPVAGQAGVERLSRTWSSYSR